MTTMVNMEDDRATKSGMYTSSVRYLHPWLHSWKNLLVTVTTAIIYTGHGIGLSSVRRDDSPPAFLPNRIKESRQFHPGIQGRGRGRGLWGICTYSPRRCRVRVDSWWYSYARRISWRVEAAATAHPLEKAESTQLSSPRAIRKGCRRQSRGSDLGCLGFDNASILALSSSSCQAIAVARRRHFIHCQQRWRDVQLGVLRRYIWRMRRYEGTWEILGGACHCRNVEDASTKHAIAYIEVQMEWIDTSASNGISPSRFSSCQLSAGCD